MPSDPTGRQPQGVLTRPAPDFFDDSLAVGLGEIIGTVANQTLFFSVSLFNNASTGQVFKVYGLTAESFATGGLVYFFIKGTVGTQYGACSSIRADLGQTYGLLYTQQMPAAGLPTNPFITATPIGGIGSAGESYTVVSPFPMFIIPAGYSLVACNPLFSVGSGGFLYAGGAGFWYQVANE